jgi:hypothetical protein
MEDLPEPMVIIAGSISYSTLLSWKLLNKPPVDASN